MTDRAGESGQRKEESVVDSEVQLDWQDQDAIWDAAISSLNRGRFDTMQEAVEDARRARLDLKGRIEDEE